MVRGTSSNWLLLKSQLIIMATFAERVRFNTCVLHPREGGILNKVLYGEALPRRLTSYSLTEDPPGLWNYKKNSRLETTAATSRQRFWSKILSVHKLARDFFTTHTDLFFWWFVCFSFLFFLLVFLFVWFCFKLPFSRTKKTTFC